MTYTPTAVIDFWDIFVPDDYWESMQRTGDSVVGEPELGDKILFDSGWQLTSYSGSSDQDFPLQELYDEYATTNPLQEFVAVPTHPIMNNWIILRREYQGF